MGNRGGGRDVRRMGALRRVVKEEGEKAERNSGFKVSQLES